MKTRFRTSIVAVSLFLLPALQLAAQSEPTITERGPHHRVWERTLIETRPDGTTAERKSRYTELATGLHYQNERGEWLDSREEIEIFQGAATARQGQHQVIFADNLNSPGAIDLLAPDGKRFRSHVLGLAYTDFASGKSVMIAEVKDCRGAVLPPNQVFYQDAFAGDCLADVRYTYTKGAFEQDIILLTAPPSPAAYGFNPDTTRLEVFTEFIEAPEATVTSVVLKRETDPVLRQQMAEPDLIDQHLDFGVMKIGAGQAFPLEQAGPFGGAGVPTGKSLERIDGRLFLIEKVDYPGIREHLKALPQQAANQPRKVVDPANTRPLLAGWPAPKGARGIWKANQYAKATANRKGLVLDYITLNGSVTNYVFKGDTTYYVNNSTVILYGTNVFEGGTVVKFSGSASRLGFLGSIDCRTSPYRPAIFTGKDDDTVGETISGSTGSPGTNRYGGRAFDLSAANTTYDLHDLHFRYPYKAIYVASSSVTSLLSHVQVGYADIAIQNSYPNFTARNLLIHDSGYAIFSSASTGTNRLENVTSHRVGYLCNAGTVYLTNSLLICVTNGMTYTGANNATNIDDTGVFQTVGTATHYLATGSTNRNAGTTNINPTLLADLKKRTTYPPIVIGDGTWFTNSLTLYPQAQRDTDTPDLGYHYDCLDYVFSALALTNATITAMPGVAIGTRTLNSYGLGLLGGAKFFCEGTPDNLNRIVRYNMVQEQSNTNWTEFASGGGSIITAWTPSSIAPYARIRFTEWSVPASYEMYHFWGYSEDAGSHEFRDCQFHSGILYVQHASIGVTNCLFNRTRILLEEYYDMNPTFRNCTLVGCDLQLAHIGSGTWTFQNNLFDATTNSYVTGSFTNSYNAYTTNATRLTPTNVNDVRLSVTNITYNTGWLGRFYLPTNLASQSTLFNKGSTNAQLLTFYHYTTTTNQVKETNSTVDIGFHYVAVNASGQPLDTDGDGLADYFEDTNGNGSPDSGETDWLSYNSFNGITGSPGLQVFTPLR